MFFNNFYRICPNERNQQNSKKIIKIFFKSLRKRTTGLESDHCLLIALNDVTLADEDAYWVVDNVADVNDNISESLTAAS